MDCDINASTYHCLGLSGYPASSCFAIFHSIVPSAEIPCSGLLESRALKFGMFLWGVPAGPAEPMEPAGCLDWWGTFLKVRPTQATDFRPCARRGPPPPTHDQPSPRPPLRSRGLDLAQSPCTSGAAGI